MELKEILVGFGDLHGKLDFNLEILSGFIIEKSILNNSWNTRVINQKHMNWRLVKMI